jgi:hypothetical protein
MSHHVSALEKVITRKINECWVAPPQEPSSCLSSGSNGGSNYVAGLASRPSCSALKYSGYLEYLINCVENSLSSEIRGVGKEPFICTFYHSLWLFPYNSEGLGISLPLL